MRLMCLILASTALAVQAGLSPLEAISMIESGNDDWAVGGAGEVSRYQIQPRVWRQFSPSTDYANPRAAATVAQQYLAWLDKYFQDRTGRAPDDFDRYVLWNAGPGYYGKVGFSKSRVHRKIRDRAQRYVNLREMRPVNTVSIAQATTAARP